MNEGFIFLAGAEIAENPKSVDLPFTQQTLRLKWNSVHMKQTF